MIFRFTAHEIGASVYVQVDSAQAIGQPFTKRGTLRFPSTQAAALRWFLIRSGGDQRPDGSILVEATSESEEAFRVALGE